MFNKYNNTKWAETDSETWAEIAHFLSKAEVVSMIFWMRDGSKVRAWMDANNQLQLMYLAGTITEQRADKDALAAAIVSYAQHYNDSQGVENEDL